ncbi:MAG: hypothetical protein HC904_05300 [Blastochloris sp.]|nr:hypothetical protein [Blastochloris sp.]
MKITIVGQGAWGSAMGKALERNGHEVEFLHRKDRAWPSGGPGDFVLLALPCQNLRERLLDLSRPEVPVFSLIKGIEISSRKRVSQVVEEMWPGQVFGVISGPSLASEVQAQSPTALVVASDDEEWLRRVQGAIHQPMLRTYRSRDVVGVELGGALKKCLRLGGEGCVRVWVWGRMVWQV